MFVVGEFLPPINLSSGALGKCSSQLWMDFCSYNPVNVAKQIGIQIVGLGESECCSNREVGSS
jgi:hypothetical protein